MQARKNGDVKREVEENRDAINVLVFPSVVHALRLEDNQQKLGPTYLARDEKSSLHVESGGLGRRPAGNSGIEVA